MCSAELLHFDCSTFKGKMSSMSENKMPKGLKIAYIVTFMGMLTAGGIAVVFGPVKNFSENENRYLTTLPALNWESIKSGEYQENLEKASSDQFPFRDQWLGMTTGMVRCFGKNCVNHVYLGKDGYFLEQVIDSDLPQKNYQTNLRILQMFREKYKMDCKVMMVPSPSTVLADKLPVGAVEYNSDKLEEQGRQLFGENWLDVKTPLIEAAKKEQVYFRTDHHWTLQGAYQGYKTLCQAEDFASGDWGSFQPKVASKDFLGTMYSKVLTFAPKKDTIRLVEKLAKSVKVTCDGKTWSLYDRDKLKVKDKYAVYFGGNFGCVEIENPEAASEETLVVIKDSFANSMVPFLIGHYKKIVMIDLRYYNQSLGAFVEKEKKCSVLVLYEMSNFAKDDNLHKLIM